MIRLLLPALVAVLAGGCMVGPDYHRPPVRAPEQFQYMPTDAADTADTRWWEQFGDPVFDALIVEGLAHNSNIAIAAANVEQAAAVLTQVRSPLFPQFGYAATGERQKSVEPALVRLLPRDIDPTTAYQALLSASWEIDLWGRIRRQSETARADLLATDEARRGVILSVVASIASSYLQLRGLDAQLVVAKKTLAAYVESVRLFELQFAYGQVSKMTVVQAQSQYETAAAQIPLIESQIAQNQNALAVLIGRDPGPIARGRSLDDLVLPKVPAGVPSALLERRPDLLQAEQQLIAANAQIGAARALYFPTISLTGAYGGVSAELSKLFSGASRVWNYSGSIVGPIFTFGAISGQVAQAEAAQRAALLNYQLAIRNAFADVDNALVANQKLAEQYAAQQRLVVALREYSRLARLQYDGGYAPYSTVLQAEQTLFPAELGLASMRSSLFASAVNIYKAIGGGWVGVADALTGSGGKAAGEAGPTPAF
ncbi:efflux transporter outer membrane subunit [Accumulibacter sp.]|uniref:efflux transporter outer membrane subunit n=1 Tax=Accumulibacter sp. TaxID=2053492 RepID=UPI0025E5AACC|nr:efflux transporter outer membrane subunit [Accumulibacter sp.]MCM8596316.1 efflux transporter outer membrane subunit [Accumulibacter sp.]MCM8627450.1 efflux transporter outer membrane subunit [Accumulibacter sp.]MDS4050465.1 efflux transporter outer membrane subunit [Accumulibacter sp.]